MNKPDSMRSKHYTITMNPDPDLVQIVEYLNWTAKNFSKEDKECLIMMSRNDITSSINRISMKVFCETLDEVNEAYDDYKIARLEPYVSELVVCKRAMNCANNYLSLHEKVSCDIQSDIIRLERCASLMLVRLTIADLDQESINTR